MIARHGLDARKSFGQHFLLDPNVTRRIARAAGDLDGVSVLEVGPGPGGLTRALLGTPARSVVAVERDPRFVAALADLSRICGDRFRLVQADALGFDAVAELPAPRAVVANLPYNVGTPLLLGWLARIGEFRSLTLMFQKEVADRIAARPGSPAYGRLSVISRWAADVRPAFNLPARAFTPPPKVASTVVRLTPRADREPAEWADMERATAAAFGQRRKMLRQSLKALGPAPEELIAAAGLDPTMRAEDVDVAGFAALARALRARSGGP